MKCHIKPLRLETFKRPIQNYGQKTSYENTSRCQQNCRVAPNTELAGYPDEYLI